MSWKTAHRSFYYTDAPEPEELVLPAAETALLCIDVQNYGLVDKETAEEQARCTPIYEEMPGWQTETSGILEYEKLPEKAKKYLERLEELLSCPISFISVGPERSQTIWKQPIL